MVVQPKLRPFAASDAFTDGAGMRPPPEGAVARDDPPRVGIIASGKDGTAWAMQSPLAIDRALLERGRDRFTVFCAACHGQFGDGNTAVARRMTLVRPRDLQSDAARGYPIGRIFSASANGYGLMPSYAAELSQRERWAVAAYVQALQSSRGVRLDDLPVALRARADEALP